eukprot:4364597-Pleurochrysis_carterae.AAC.1
MTLRMALSATPFSWCTCGGHVVALTPFELRNEAKSADRNSPALSLWNVPIHGRHPPFGCGLGAP